MQYLAGASPPAPLSTSTPTDIAGVGSYCLGHRVAVLQEETLSVYKETLSVHKETLSVYKLALILLLTPLRSS